MFKRLTTLALVTALAWALLPGATAGAVQVPTPTLNITGEPTAEESATIAAEWDRLLDGLPAVRQCLTPLTVEVVPSAEAVWGGGITGIAAFYRRSIDTVFIEHGKVRAEHLIHEFAHHVDFACGFHTGPLGPQFLEAQGFGATQDWVSGSAWRNVPAEHFAEAVVGFFEIDSVDIPITPAAFDLIARFASYGPAAIVLPPQGAALRGTLF